MKKIRSIAQTLLSSALFSLSLGLAGTPAQALILDNKIGEANLGNSGEATELNALKSILTGLGIAAGDLTLDFKLEQMDSGFNVNADSVSGQWVIDTAPAQPGYFLLKFGTGGTNATADTFFFENIGELTKLVFSNAQVQFLTGGNCARNNNACNIGRLSHYSTFDSTPPFVVIPEPTALLLMGIGLIALGFGRRRALRLAYSSQPK